MDLRRLPTGPRGDVSAGRMFLWAALAVGLALFALVYYLFLTPPAVPIEVASAREILMAHAATPTVFRLEAEPRVIVLVVPTRHQEHRMLARADYLLEKAGAPRERALGDAELAAIRRTTTQPRDAAAYAHTYRAADLARLFRVMREGGIAPNPEERWLRRLLGELHWLSARASGALVALPGPGAAPDLEHGMRAALLEHEFARAAYLTIPAYAVYAQRFFYHDLTSFERASFRRFLAKRGYDTSLADLVVNETQAYLVSTPDPRSWNAAELGLAPRRLRALHCAFLQHLPAPWLRQGPDVER